MGFHSVIYSNQATVIVGYKYSKYSWLQIRHLILLFLGKGFWIFCMQFEEVCAHSLQSIQTWHVLLDDLGLTHIQKRLEKTETYLGG